jgi:hypothetical protein
VSSDDEITKEKTNSKSQTVTSSMGFGKDIKGMLYRKQMCSKWHPILCVRAVQSRSETLFSSSPSNQGLIQTWDTR